MKKLTDAQVKELQAFKYVEGGSDKFFDYILDLYKDEADLVAEIKKCRDMKDSIEWMVNYPSHLKAEIMFSENMDEVLDKIGYYGVKSSREHYRQEFERKLTKLINKHTDALKSEMEKLANEYVEELMNLK